MQKNIFANRVFANLLCTVILSSCVPAAGPIEPTATSAITVQPANTQQSFTMETRCLETDSNWHDKLKAQDILIINRYFPLSDTVAIDFNAKQERVLNGKNENFISPAVSPDHKWLFFADETFADENDESGQINLSILPSSLSAKKKVTALRNGWNIEFYWQNNQEVLISLLGKAWGPEHFVILNPFTGEYQELQSDYPSIAPNDAWQWEVSGRTMFNNDLSYVIYPTLSDKYPEPGYTIWNTKTHAEKAFIPGSVYNTPKWAPDGAKFAVALPKHEIYVEELFTVGLDEKTSQLTDLNEKYPNIDIGNMSWSPDGKHIVFWALTNPNDNSISHLFLLSMDTGEVIDYCIPGKQDNFTLGNFSYASLLSPVWSSDSRYIAFATVAKDGNIQTVVVDIMEAKAFQVAEKMQPVGWMIKEP